jgi:hypothetical protein
MISTLKDSGITVHFILFCETFLVANNAFVHNSRKSMSRGGVAMYISNNFSFIERPDLGINHEEEFDCIFF